MIKLIVYLAIIGGLAYCGATVKLGDKTFFEHVRAIWHTEEVQDLKHGVEDKAGPTVDKLTGYLSIIDQFDDFQKGVLDTTHVVYYVSFITFGLFLTAKSVDSERWRG